MFSEQFLNSFASTVAERVAVILAVSLSGAQQRLMTVAEVAKYISKSKQAVYHMVNQNLIPHKYIGSKLCFDRVDIDRWIDGLEE